MKRLLASVLLVIGLAGSTVLIDGLTRNSVSNKLGPSAGTELEQWSATGGKPSNSQLLPDAAYATELPAAASARCASLAARRAGRRIVSWRKQCGKRSATMRRGKKREQQAAHAGVHR